MFNFIKKKEGLGLNTEEQNCCCSETIKDSCCNEITEDCCGCDCKTEASSMKSADCCSK